MVVEKKIQKIKGTHNPLLFDTSDTLLTEIKTDKGQLPVSFSCSLPIHNMSYTPTASYPPWAYHWPTTHDQDIHLLYPEASPLTPIESQQPVWPVYYSEAESPYFPWGAYDPVYTIPGTAMALGPSLSSPPAPPLSAISDDNTLPTPPLESPVRALPRTKKSKKTKDRKKCSNCGATKTPSWRRGSLSSRLLCNACGLYEKVNGRERIVIVHQDGTTRVSKTQLTGAAPIQCCHCSTFKAKRWHLSHQGHLCETCQKAV